MSISEHYTIENGSKVYRKPASYHWEDFYGIPAIVVTEPPVEGEPIIELVRTEPVKYYSTRSYTFTFDNF